MRKADSRCSWEGDFVHSNKAGKISGQASVVYKKRRV